MTGRTFDRTAATGGLAFTVLAFASVAIVPATPGVDAGADTIRQYLTDNRAGFGLSAALMAAAVLAISLLFGYVHRRLVDTDQNTAVPACFLVAAATTVVLALTGALFQGVLAQYTETGVDDSTLVVLYRTWNVIAFMGPPLPVAVVLLLVGSRSIRSRLFPKWLGWIALVAAVGGGVTGLIALGASTRPPAVLDFGSFLLSCVCFTAISVHSLLRGTASGTGRATVDLATPDLGHTETAVEATR